MGAGVSVVFVCCQPVSIPFAGIGIGRKDESSSFSGKDKLGATANVVVNVVEEAKIVGEVPGEKVVEKVVSSDLIDVRNVECQEEKTADMDDSSEDSLYEPNSSMIVVVNCLSLELRTATIKGDEIGMEVIILSSNVDLYSNLQEEKHCECADNDENDADSSSKHPATATTNEESCRCSSKTTDYSRVAESKEEQKYDDYDDLSNVIVIDFSSIIQESSPNMCLLTTAPTDEHEQMDSGQRIQTLLNGLYEEEEDMLDDDVKLDGPTIGPLDPSKVAVEQTTLTRRSKVHSIVRKLEKKMAPRRGLSAHYLDFCNTPPRVANLTPGPRLSCGRSLDYDDNNNINEKMTSLGSSSSSSLPSSSSKKKKKLKAHTTTRDRHVSMLDAADGEEGGSILLEDASTTAKQTDASTANRTDILVQHPQCRLVLHLVGGWETSSSSSSSSEISTLVSGRYVSSVTGTDLSSSDKRSGDRFSVDEMLRQLKVVERRQKRRERYLAQLTSKEKAEEIVDDHHDCHDKIKATAKKKGIRIPEPMNEIRGRQFAVPDREEQERQRAEYLRLERELERHNAAFMLTELYREEEAKKEIKWENDNLEENLEALKKIRRHMPVNIRTMSEESLTKTITPNGTHLPEPVALKFKRTSVLQLLRIDPSDIERLHPSVLEDSRVTDLTLVERRALHHHLKSLGPKWEAGKSGKLTERRWAWYEMMKNIFNEELALHSRFMEEFGPSGNCNDEESGDSSSVVLLDRTTCLLNPDADIDYSGDYGYPESDEFELLSKYEQRSIASSFGVSTAEFAASAASPSGSKSCGRETPEPNDFRLSLDRLKTATVLDTAQPSVTLAGSKKSNNESEASYNESSISGEDLFAPIIQKLQVLSDQNQQVLETMTFLNETITDLSGSQILSLTGGEHN